MRKIKLFYASHVALAPRFTQTHLSGLTYGRVPTKGR